MAVDISNLKVSPSVQVFRLKKGKRISNKVLKAFFKECTVKKNSRNYILNIDRESLNTAVYSIRIFKTNIEPSFLTNTDQLEIKYAFLLFIEFNNYIFIFKKNIDNPYSKIKDYIEPFDYQDISLFKSNDDTKYEKVFMNNMSISDEVIRNKSYEGKSLNMLMPSNSLSRSIASSFRINNNGEIYSIVPNTSRITYRSSKLNISEVIEWIKNISQEFDRELFSNSFLDNFAKPISLDYVKQRPSNPVAIFIDLEEIETLLHEDGNANLIYIDENGEQLVDDRKRKLLFEIFKSPISLIEGDKKGKFKMVVKNCNSLGEIKLNKKTVTVNSKIGDKVFIRKNSEEDVSIRQFININKPISIVFDDPSYMYFSRNIFEDSRLLNNLEGMLSIFRDDYNFNQVRSEKEKPHENDINNFPDASLFSAIENNILEESPNCIVICDDMNDEWADHIILNSELNPPRVVFIHSKYVKKESYGASKFHEVIAQALKNLGRINSREDDYRRKYDSKWNSNYENTQINRIRTNHNWNDIQNSLSIINSNPNTTKEVVLATPFLRKSVFANKMEDLRENRNCPAHYIQILWLISTFISACRDYGVKPYIYCRP